MNNWMPKAIVCVLSAVLSMNAAAELTVIEPISNTPKSNDLTVIEPTRSDYSEERGNSQAQLIRHLQYENQMLRNELSAMRAGRNNESQASPFPVKDNQDRQIFRRTYRVYKNSVSITGNQLSELTAIAKNASRLSITGYSDSRGSKQVRQKAAKSRAESLKRKLIAKGVSQYKIATQGVVGNYIASNATAAGRQKNRRVSVVIE